jgi:hypothetical protein
MGDDIMLFPKEKMQIITAYEGKTSDEGWLVLDLSKIDAEGLSKIYVDLRDVQKLQQHKDEQADLLKKTKDLLSLDED